MFCLRVSLNGNDFRQANASPGSTKSRPEILVQGSGVAAASDALVSRGAVTRSPEQMKRMNGQSIAAK